MSAEPESLVLHLLCEMRAEITAMRGDMVSKGDLKSLRDELRSDLHSLRADVAADFIEVREEIAGVKKDLGEQIVGLRRAVVEYHTTVVGHGVLISELDARVRTIETYLELPVSDGH